ncbi:hypothetical protein FRC12_018925 [Ceratobasidium sp. 428]|nr:hypothetical protein FRC12_018925 [Ceratobasidium sp. 428]
MPATPLGESRRFQEKPKLNIVPANGISMKPSRALGECSGDDSDQSFTSEKELPLGPIQEVSEGEDASAEILSFPKPAHLGVRSKVAGSPPIRAGAPNLPRFNKLFAETCPPHFQPPNCLAPRSNCDTPSHSSWLGSHHR